MKEIQGIKDTEGGEKCEHRKDMIISSTWIRFYHFDLYFLTPTIGVVAEGDNVFVNADISVSMAENVEVLIHARKGDIIQVAAEVSGAGVRMIARNNYFLKARKTYYQVRFSPLELEMPDLVRTQSFSRFQYPTFLRHHPWNLLYIGV